MTEHAAQFLSVFSVLLLFALLGHASWSRHFRKRKWTGHRSWTKMGRRPRLAVVPSASVFPNITDPKEQLEAVSRVDFEKRKLLNREEVPVLRLLEQIAREAGAGFRVMAQTSLGEIIRPKPGSGTEQELQSAFRSINSKRIDFGIFDRFGRLVVAVEYQGSGHYHQTSFMRDAVKQEALRKAGVHFIAIENGFGASEVLPRLRRALGLPPSAERGERAEVAAQRAAADPEPADRASTASRSAR
jgi:hypothetical protein